MFEPSQPVLIRAIDLETTGEEPDVHPIEVGFSDIVSTVYDLAGSPIEWRWEDMDATLVRCPVPISPETSAVHHIVDDDLKDAPAWPETWRGFIQESVTGVSPSVYVAHSAKSDRVLVTDEITGGKPWICTYKVALRLWPEAPKFSLQALRYWRKPATLERRYAPGAHRAMQDAYVTSHLLMEMLKEASIPDMIEWSSKPALLPRVGFSRGHPAHGKPWSEVDTGLLHWILERDFDEDTMFTARTELDRRDEEDRKAREEWERQRA